MSLSSLNDLILIHILLHSSNPKFLALTCKRFANLWEMASVKADWLLKHSYNPQDALEKACLIHNNYSVCKSLISRRCKSFPPIWLGHVVVDLCRTQVLETQRKEREDIIRLLVHSFQLDSNLDMTLYIKALVFMDQPHQMRNHLLNIVSENQEYVSLKTVCLYFCRIYRYETCTSLLLFDVSFHNRPNLSS